MANTLSPFEQKFAAANKLVVGRDFAPAGYNNGQTPPTPPNLQWAAAVSAAGKQAGLDG